MLHSEVSQDLVGGVINSVTFLEGLVILSNGTRIFLIVECCSVIPTFLIGTSVIVGDVASVVGDVVVVMGNSVVVGNVVIVDDIVVGNVVVVVGNVVIVVYVAGKVVGSVPIVGAVVVFR